LGTAVTWPSSPRVLLEWLTADGRTVLRRDYDVMIADRGLGSRRPAGGTHLLRWSASVTVSEPGPYELDLRGEGALRVVIDDRQVWPRSGDLPAPFGGPPETRWLRVDLPPGVHRLVIERHRFDGGELTLYWRRRGGAGTIVPIEAFAPLAWP